MSKVKYALFAFICLFVFPIMSHAECDYQRMAELNKIASNVQFSYSYELDEKGKPIVYVHVLNTTDDIYIDSLTASGLLVERLDNNKEITLDFFTSAGMTFNVYSNDINCQGEKLLTRYIEVPDYNFFYETDECKKYPDFKYCKLWSNNVNHDVFYSELNDYINRNKNIDNSSDGYGNHNNVTEYLNVYIIIGVLLASIIVIFFYLRRRR